MEIVFKLLSSCPAQQVNRCGASARTSECAKVRNRVRECRDDFGKSIYSAGE